jgi:hypothetical protein
MPKANKYHVFVSYSRKDCIAVRGIVPLLQIGDRHVFLDQYELELGENWRKGLKSAIRGSEMVVLIWCCDSSQSLGVAEEIKIAKELKRTIVPVMLCRMEMPPWLADIQGVDLTAVVRHPCVHSAGPLPSADRSAKDAVLSWAAKQPSQSLYAFSPILIGIYFNGFFLATFFAMLSSFLLAELCGMSGRTSLNISAVITVVLWLYTARRIIARRKFMLSFRQKIVEEVVANIIQSAELPL